jgi:hypothetical protein
VSCVVSVTILTGPEIINIQSKCIYDKILLRRAIKESHFYLQFENYSNMNKGNSNLLSAIRKDNLKCSIVGGESKIAETISKSFSESKCIYDKILLRRAIKESHFYLQFENFVLFYSLFLLPLFIITNFLFLWCPAIFVYIL